MVCGTVSMETLLTEGTVFDTKLRDVPALMLINEEADTYSLWRLHESVESIELTAETPESVTLRVVNAEPLRIELWVDGTNEIDVELVLSDDVSATAEDSD